MTPEQARETLAKLAAYDFAWDIEKALEFALFRSFAVPSISGLLARTGEFEERTRKRYDDTELILAEILENGPESERGTAALDRMNAMHGAYRIANEDLLYVLSTFVLEPIRWTDRFGWRRMTEREREAAFVYYGDLGRRMGIEGIPETRRALEHFNRDFEACRFRWAESNARIGAATTDLLLSFYLPRPLVAFGRPAVAALMDEALRRAMGVANPPQWLQRAVPAALRLRARCLRTLPKRKRPRLITTQQRPTYPRGYCIRELGTFPGREM